MERIVKRRVFFCAAILFFVAAGWSTSALATDRFVDDAGTDSGTCTTASSPCLTIAYALTQATSGDTIKVAKGTYTFTNVQLAGSMSITFEGGYDTSDNFATTGLGVRGSRMTRLINSGSDWLFNFTGDTNTTTIKNFVIQAGLDGTGNVPIGSQDVYNVSPTIEGNTITGCGGNAIVLQSASGAPVIRNNVILESGNGIMLDYTGYTGSAINNTVVNTNDAAFDGGRRRERTILPPMVEVEGGRGRGSTLVVAAPIRRPTAMPIATRPISPRIAKAETMSLSPLNSPTARPASPPD